MKKDFDIFNDIEIDLAEFENDEINDMEKKKLKKEIIKKIKEKKYNKKIVSGLIISFFIGGILILRNEGVYAKILSEVETFFSKSNEQLEPYKISGDDINITKVIDHNGLKVSFSDLILDDMYLLGKIEIDWSDVDINKYGIEEKEIDNVEFKSWGESNLYLNDKVISKKSSIYDEKKDEKKFSQFIRIEYNPENIDLTKKQKFTYLIEDLRLETKDHSKIVEHVAGEWSFDVEIDGRELSKKLKVIKINNKQSFENEFYRYDLLIKEYRESPISKKIILKDNSEWKNSCYTIKTEFYDENENKIEYNWVAANDERIILEIKDNKKYKKIKIINTIIDTKNAINKEVKKLEPVIINLEN